MAEASLVSNLTRTRPEIVHEEVKNVSNRHVWPSHGVVGALHDKNESASD